MSETASEEGGDEIKAAINLLGREVQALKAQFRDFETFLEITNHERFAAYRGMKKRAGHGRPRKLLP